MPTPHYSTVSTYGLSRSAGRGFILNRCSQWRFSICQVFGHAPLRLELTKAVFVLQVSSWDEFPSHAGAAEPCCTWVYKILQCLCPQLRTHNCAAAWNILKYTVNPPRFLLIRVSGRHHHLSIFLLLPSSHPLCLATASSRPTMASTATKKI